MDSCICCGEESCFTTEENVLPNRRKLLANSVRCCLCLLLPPPPHDVPVGLVCCHMARDSGRRGDVPIEQS